ncbi:MAG: mannitol dehydrogenase family protein, partial [Novosphingobium sp.]
LAGAARDGRTITDPLAAPLLERAGDWRSVLAMREVFGDLGTDARFVGAVEAGLAALDAGRLEPVAA